MKKFLVLLAALFVLASNEVKADDGLYLDVFGGANWLNVDKKSHHGSRHTKLDFQTGYLVGGAIGYKYCNNYRFEGEIVYRYNKLKSKHFREEFSLDSGSEVFFDSSSHKVSGHLRSLAFMANVYYDYAFDCSPWSVYVGGGIGYADQKLKIGRFTFSDTGSDYSSSNNRRRKFDNHFAAQAKVGMAYAICDNMFFDIGYTFFWVKDCYNNGLVFGYRAGF